MFLREKSIISVYMKNYERSPYKMKAKNQSTINQLIVVVSHAQERVT